MTSNLHGVLVTYRRGPQLRQYLDALAAQTRQLDSLVVIDNDPAESARSVLSESKPTSMNVDYVATGENLGPAGGIARGMDLVLAHASDDDWLISLDDDDPPRTAELLAEIERFGNDLRASDPTVGLVGLVGSLFDERRGRFVPIPDDELRGPVAVSWIGGNNLPTYSVGAVRRVGVFDPRLFFSMEELEFGLRLLDHEVGIYAHGDLWRREREHQGRLGIDRSPNRWLDDPSWRRYYSVRNLILILRRRDQWLGVIAVVTRSLAKPVANIPRDPGRAYAHLRLNARAVWDGLRGNSGRTVEPNPKPSPAADR